MTPIITFTPQRLPAIKKLLDEQGIWADNPDLMARVEFAINLLGQTTDANGNAHIALADIRQYAESERRGIHRQAAAHIDKIAEYGLGQSRRPNPPALIGDDQ